MYLRYSVQRFDHKYRSRHFAHQTKSFKPVKEMDSKEFIYVSTIMPTKITLLEMINSILICILNVIGQVLIHCTDFCFILQFTGRPEATDVSFQDLWYDA